MPTETWEVAELLESIARNADVIDIMYQQVASIIRNTRYPNVQTLIQTDAQQNTVTVRYLIPVDVAMQGVSGSPAEVLEWLKTGNSSDRYVEILNWPNKPHFSVTQIFHEGHMLEDVRALSDKWTRALIKTYSKPTKPNQ